jgi:carbohydrate-selective porin OprB
MTGDWGTARPALEDRGVTFVMDYTGDASTLVAGTAGSAPVGRALTEAGVELDLGRLWGQRGGRAFVQYQWKTGGIGSDCATEGQGFSNIDADDFSRFGELWFEQQLGERVRVKVGRIDANTEFAFVENGEEFLNSSMGFTPTIALLPTYPDPHAGVVVQMQPAPGAYIGGGVFNAGPAVAVDDFGAVFSIGEAGLRWEARGGGRLGIGYWHAGGQAAGAEGVTARLSTGGGYLVFDQALWSGDQRSLAMFAQFGLSDRRWSRVAGHAAAGITAKGFVPARPSDVIGFAVTGVKFGDEIAWQDPVPAEVNIGGFYKLALSPWFAIKPDVQYVMHPLGTSRNVVVGTVRAEIGF